MAHGQGVISEKISKLKKEGYKHTAAVATALEMARAGKLGAHAKKKVPKKKGKKRAKKRKKSTRRKY